MTRKGEERDIDAGFGRVDPRQRVGMMENPTHSASEPDEITHRLRSRHMSIFDGREKGAIHVALLRKHVCCFVHVELGEKSDG